MIKIYIGSAVFDYATPLCMGLDKQKVEEKMKSYKLDRPCWVDEYELNKNDVIEFDE